MFRISLTTILFLIAVPLANGATSLHDFTLRDIDGNTVSLGEFKGKVVLVVNTASQCGFALQLADLQELYEQYRSQEFEIIAVPSNDFGGAEPGGEQAIKKVCQGRFGARYLLTEKTEVAGDKITPLFKFLTAEGPPELRGEIKFNFEKFLIGKDGQVLARFGSFTNPLSYHLREELESALKDK